MARTLQEIISRFRNDSPLLGRKAREYIADALEVIFTSHTSHFGTSQTAENITQKHVLGISTGFEGTPGRGTKLSVHFTHGNTAQNPTLLVGANAPAMPIVNLSNWAANSTVEFVCDGPNWRMISAKVTTAVNPLMDGNAAPGTDNGLVSRQDHRHPAYVHHGSSASEPDSANKAVHDIVPEFNPNILRQGVRISVLFAHTNSHPNPTLSIGDSAARPISNLSNWAAGSTVDFVSAGNTWRMIGVKKTTNAAPLMDNIANPGTDNGNVSREDHVHHAYVHHGSSGASPEAATKAVAGVSPPINPALLRQGVRLSVEFINTNSNANPALSVENTGAIPIVNLSNWADGSTVDFVLQDSGGSKQWRMIGAKKSAKSDPVVDTEGKAIVGTDNGQLATADHSHILYVDHHTDHTTRGRFVFDRLPTSKADNTLLRVSEANTSPYFDKVHLTKDLAERLPLDHMATSDVPNTVLRVAKEGTSPVFDKVQLKTDLEGRLPLNHMATNGVANTVLRVNEPGTDPVFGKINLPTDFEGTLPVNRGGTGAENPDGARHNLNAMSDTSPLTGGRMVKRAVNMTRTITESWGNSGSTTEDIPGWVTGAILTDGIIVYSNGVTLDTAIRVRPGETTISIFPRHVHGVTVGTGGMPAQLMFTMHLPPETE